MTEPSKIFPKRLAQARDLRKLSQAELATRAKLQPSAISHFETGTRKPSFDNLKRLADALSVSTDFLLGRSDSISGTGSTDILYRDIERLSTADREVASSVIQSLAARNTKGDGGGKGS